MSRQWLLFAALHCFCLTWIFKWKKYIFSDEDTDEDPFGLLEDVNVHIEETSNDAKVWRKTWDLVQLDMCRYANHMNLPELLQILPPNCKEPRFIF